MTGPQSRNWKSFLQDKDPEKIQKACTSLGAEFIETKADLCAVFPVLPRYPVTLKIWFADEEFPASGKIFLQDHADHYLSVEDAVTVGEILLQKLSEASFLLSDHESENFPARI